MRYSDVLELDVFLEDVIEPIGRLSRTDDGDMSFRYLSDNPRHRISLSLPMQDEPFRDAPTRAFFSNLLFENAQRDQVMQRHGLDYSDIVGLLRYLGRDCPGAISIVPKGAGPAKQPGRLSSDYDLLDNGMLLRIMQSLRDHQRLPDGTNDPSPLAGIQGKIAVTQFEDGRLALPRAGLNVPTTHILKVPRAREMHMVVHEHILMQIASDVLDHPVARTSVIGDGDLQGLLVTRYDRLVESGAVHRIHQEDFCQALGLGSSLKYQRNGSETAIFSAKAVGRLLTACENPGRARQAFLEVTLVNLLLGNTDNHAKNHALIYRGDRPELAPFYDIVPTLLDPEVTHQLSFDIGNAKVTDDITEADILVLVEDLGYRRMTPALRGRLHEITEKVVDQIPRMSGPALKRIGDVICEQAKWVAPALGSKTDIPVGDLIVINRPD